MRFSFLRDFTILATSLTLIACSSASHPVQVSSSGSVMTKTYASVEDAQSVYDSLQLNCKSPLPFDCPNQVGQLIVMSGNQLGFCTATLIANDAIIANSHCMDFDDVSADQLCSSTIVVFANQSPLGREVAECDKVLIKSNINKNVGANPDYLILKLKKPLARGFYPLSQEGMKDHERLKISKVNPDASNNLNAKTSELETTHCTVLQNTIIHPESNTNDSPIEVLKGCEVIPGNSGTSLINSENKTVGVIFGHLEPDPQSAWITKAISLKTAMSTNATCIDFSSVGESHLSSNCQKTSSSDKMTAPLSESDLAPLKDFIKQKDSEINKKFVYQFANSTSDFHNIEYKPVCFSNPAIWIKDYTNGIFSNIANSATTIVNVLRWHEVQDIDDDLKSVFRAEPISPRQISISFNPQNISMLGVSRVTLTEISDDKSAGTTSKDNFGFCDQ